MRLLSARNLFQKCLFLNKPKYFHTPNIKCYSSNTILLTDIVKTVKPFGKVLVNLPYDVEVKATCPHDYPDMNTVLVKLVSNKDLLDPENKVKEDLICVNITNDACEVRTNDEEANVVLGNVRCLIETPVCYDVDVKTTGDANVKVSDMISDSILVETEFGNIVGSKLQGKKITLSSSEGGSVTVQKSITGVIEINTAKNGCVDAEKCLGTKLDVSTECGSVNLGSNYCENATFTTLDGNLNLNNLHMDNKIDISGKGSLNITCFDGSLEANVQEGSTEIQLTRITKDSSITSKGDIKLTIPETLDAKLTLKSPILEIDESLNSIYDKTQQELLLGNGKTTCNVESSRKIEIEQSNWMEAFKLQNTPSKMKSK